MMSARLRAISRASARRSGLSPTTVWLWTVIPRALRPWEIICASVLAMLPRSNSVPTAINSAVWDIVTPLFFYSETSCASIDILIRSTPSRAFCISPSTSRAASYSRTSSRTGWVLGCRGVKTVQQSS